MNKKKILFITTGGTIASVRTPQGLRPVLSSEELLAHMPALAQLCQPDTLALCSIDSTDMSPALWLDMARAIEQNYSRYDGFILCHGTDTLAYTAAALSYLVQNAGKPIILTGAQQPISGEITDAKKNLWDSVLCALDPGSRGVMVVFGGVRDRGHPGQKEQDHQLRRLCVGQFPPSGPGAGGPAGALHRDAAPPRGRCSSATGWTKRSFCSS